VFGCIRNWLAPVLVGKSFNSGADLDAAWLAVRGNRYAKAALDTAWWDLKARIEGKPLHAALGGRNEGIELGVSLDQMPSIDDLLNALGAAFDAGFSRVELKIRPGWDINMLNIVRHEYPTQTIHGDVEGALHLDDMEILCRFDDFGLAMVEQPLPADDLVGMAMVQDTIKTPVCLDEAITTLEQADMALELKSGQYVNVKPGRVGGLTAAAAIHDACHEQCVPCYVGATPQSAIGVRHGLALAAKPNFSYPADFISSEELFEQDLAEPPRPVLEEDGKLRVALWSEPGIGVEPDLTLLEEFCLAKAKV
jgi:O-succinylbenzoate synthase